MNIRLVDGGERRSGGGLQLPCTTLECLHHANNLCQRPRLHLAHGPATVEFDGDLAQTELRGDLLVEKTRSDELQHLALAAGKRLEPGAKGSELILLLFQSPVFSKRAGYGLQDILVAKRLREDIDGTRLPRGDRHRDVTVTGDEQRSEERRGGRESVSRFRYRGATCH